MTINGGSIGSDAFSSCTALTSVTINSGSIGDGAFQGCTNLVNLTLNEGITSIGRSFISCSSLSSVIIPSSVTSIGTAFASCTSLESVTVLSATPPTLNSSAFADTSANLVIYVPVGSVDTYKSASGWSSYASKIQAIPNN